MINYTNLQPDNKNNAEAKCGQCQGKIGEESDRYFDLYDTWQDMRVIALTLACPHCGENHTITIKKVEDPESE